MTISDTATASDYPSVFRSASHEIEVYGLMLEFIDCGPFDGGCLLFALALQRLHGGQVLVLEGRGFTRFSGAREPQYEGELQAQHAVLKLPDGKFMDAAGVTTERRIIERTARLGRFCASIVAAREMREGDLEDAPKDGDIVAVLARALDYDAPQDEHCVADIISERETSTAAHERSRG